MHRSCKSTIKTITTIAPYINYSKERNQCRHKSILADLLSTAHEQCIKNPIDQTESPSKHLENVPASEIISTIEQYEGTKDLLTNSPVQIQKIGKAKFNTNVYSLISTSIVYPDKWCPPPSFTRSPYHILSNKQSEHEIKDWYTSIFGKFLSPPTKQRLWQLEPAEWSAFLVPYAAYNYVDLMGKFLSIFALIDDQLVEIEALEQKRITLEHLFIFAETWKLAFQRQNGQQMNSKNLARRIHELALKTNISVLDPCFQVWSSIADNYVRFGADETWCNRMSNAIKEWIELGIREVIGKRRMKQSSSLTELRTQIPVTLTSYDHPSLRQGTKEKTVTVDMSGMSLLEVLLRQRIATIGIPMMSLLLEQSCGLNLSSIDPLLRPAINIAAIMPSLVNELVGMGRDLRGEPNFSLIYRQMFNCSLQQSIYFTLTLHDLAMKTFDQNIQKILQSLKSPSLQHHVSIYMQYLRLLIRGFAQWHHYSDRFKNLIALDETHKQILIFSIADGLNQRYDALQDALLQYQSHKVIHESLY
ncbi:unnamed protein product [Rotaria sp. Silwood1]|nr:unnamed protein product [Rotaria sp. Silwood1]